MVDGIVASIRRPMSPFENHESPGSTLAARAFLSMFSNALRKEADDLKPEEAICPNHQAFYLVLQSGYSHSAQRNPNDPQEPQNDYSHFAQRDPNDSPEPQNDHSH